MLAFAVFSFTPLLAQKKTTPKNAPATKAATSTTSQSAPIAKAAVATVKTFVNCKVTAESNGCAILFANIENNAKPIILKKYFVDQRNAVQDVTLGDVEAPAKKTTETLVMGEGNVEAKTENATVKNVQLTVTVGGSRKDFKMVNGECNIPADFPYGSYPITLTWSWGSETGKANFMGDFKEGHCVAIYQYNK